MEMRNCLQHFISKVMVDQFVDFNRWGNSCNKSLPPEISGKDFFSRLAAASRISAYIFWPKTFSSFKSFKYINTRRDWKFLSVSVLSNQVAGLDTEAAVCDPRENKQMTQAFSRAMPSHFSNTFQVESITTSISSYLSSSFHCSSVQPINKCLNMNNRMSFIVSH